MKKIWKALKKQKSLIGELLLGIMLIALISGCTSLNTGVGVGVGINPLNKTKPLRVYSTAGIGLGIGRSISIF